MSHPPSQFLSVFALLFFLAGFIRPELYLMLKICVKLYIKIFYVQHTYLQVCANGIIVVFFVFFFPSYVQNVFRDCFMLFIKVNFSFYLLDHYRTVCLKTDHDHVRIAG